MIDPVLSELASFASRLSASKLPRDVLDVAKDCVLGALSGALTFGATAESRYALAAIEACPAPHGATIFGCKERAGAADAAFVNATSAATTGRGDTHVASASHPGTVIVPCVLALGEARGCSGAAALEAVITGYEAMCRLGLALVTPAFAVRFRPTGMAGATAAGLAAGRAIALDHLRLVSAGSLATHTAAGLNEWAHAGTNEYTFHAGYAARNGVVGALLAEAGARSAPTILEGRSGLLAGYGALDRVAELTHELGTTFRMLDIVHKPAPACIFVQTPCQLADAMSREHRIDAATIGALEIRTSKAAAEYPGCDNAAPIASRQSGKLSIQFSVASVLVHGGIFDANWLDFANARVNALAARARVVVDPELTAAFPQRQGAHVRITMRDGTVISASQHDFRPMTRDEIIAKFVEVAESKLGAAHAARAVETILNLERLADIRELASLFH
jgi:2-methylcitrate dehydratase PrpD